MGSSKEGAAMQGFRQRMRIRFDEANKRSWAMEKEGWRERVSSKKKSEFEQ